MRSDRHDSLIARSLAPAILRTSWRAGVGALLLAVPWPAGLQAQASHFLACTTATLADCAELRLTSTVGGGTGGTTLFEIALRNAGSTTQPALPTSVYNLVLGTGLPAAASGSEVSAQVVPVPIGGATLADASPWDVFESGDALFLSALTNSGVGGCAAGPPVGGFGQAGTTCGSGQFLTFSFSTPRPLDPRRFTVLDLEVVGLAPGLPAGSCGGSRPCVITPLDGNAAPEPATLPLLASGLMLLAGVGAQRRRAAAGNRSVPDGR